MKPFVNRAAPANNAYHIRNSVRDGVDVPAVGTGHGSFVDVNLCVHSSERDWVQGATTAICTDLEEHVV